jgi:hypothetical protein
MSSDQNSATEDAPGKRHATPIIAAGEGLRFTCIKGLHLCPKAWVIPDERMYDFPTANSELYRICQPLPAVKIGASKTGGRVTTNCCHMQSEQFLSCQTTNFAKSGPFGSGIACIPPGSARIHPFWVEAKPE